MDEKAKQFLEELTELSKKYGMTIGGCGCCDSPYVYDKEKQAVVLNSIGYNFEKEKYIEDDYI